jgi:phage head maturation protease
MMVTQAEAIERVAYAPVTRIDAATREIEVTATSEALDAFGTIFDYAASKTAFERWLGNVREMHANQAVGRRVAVICDDARREVRVRLKISRGAESTWQKILDGTLCGASIGAANVTWQETWRPEIRAEPVRVATAYDLVELSLVDNPANPDCVGIAVVRGMMADVDVLDEIEGRDAKDTKDWKSAKEMKWDGNTEDTELCREDTEGDGVTERGMTRNGHGITRDDGDEDGGMNGAEGDADGDEPVTTVIDGDEAPLHAGMRALAGLCGCAACVGWLDGPTPGPPVAPREPCSPSAAGEGRARSADEVRGLEGVVRAQEQALVELRERVARMEAQPLAGGPVLRAAEKTLGGPQGGGGMNLAERIAALQAFGATRMDQRGQVEVAAEILRLQRGFEE